MASVRFMLVLLLSLLAFTAFNGMVAADDFCSMANCPAELCCVKKQEDNTVKVVCSEQPITPDDNCETPNSL